MFGIVIAQEEITLDEDKIISLEKEYLKQCIKIKKKVPKYVLDDLQDLGKVDFQEFSDKSQTWFHTDFSNIYSVEIDKLTDDLGIKGSDTAIELDSYAFIQFMRLGSLDLYPKIKSMRIYTLEATTPKQRFTPVGLHKIDWRWTLPVDSREYGTLHVGIDEETLNFICYECCLGIYYPEGETMLRIHREIDKDQSFFNSINPKETAKPSKENIPLEIDVTIRPARDPIQK